MNYNDGRQPCLMLIVLYPQCDIFGIIFYNKDKHIFFEKKNYATWVNSFGRLHTIQT